MQQEAQVVLDDNFSDTDNFSEGVPNHDDMTVLCAPHPQSLSIQPRHKLYIQFL